MLPLIAGLARAGALEVAVAELPLGLDPWAPPGTLEARLATLVYDPIIRFRSEEGPTSPVVEAAPLAGGTWRLTLGGARWHDGRPASATDLCFSILAALDPRAPLWWRAPTREFVATCSVIDARTAEIGLVPGVVDPRPGLAIPLVPRHGYPSGDPWFDPQIAREPLGTGRYRATRSESGWTMHAAAGTRATFRTLRFVSSEDPTAALLDGAADGILEIPPPRVAEVVAAEGLNVQWTARGDLVLVALDPRDGPTADPDVRRALDQLLDRTALRARTVGVDPTDKRQTATFVSGPFLPNSKRAARSVPPTAPDEAGAAELLTAAGWTSTDGRWRNGETPLRLRVAAPAAPRGDPKLLYALCGQWIAAGIEVEAILLSTDAYDRVLAGEHPLALDALLLSWAPPWDESPAALVSERGWANAFRFSDPVIEAGLRALDDPTTATQAAWDLHGRLADQAPFLFLWSNDAWSGWSEDVVPFTPFTPGDLFGAIEDWR